MLQTERVRFELLNSEYITDLEKLFCKNILVMKSTFKGRVFTKKEFENLLEKDFLKKEEDQFGFRCVVSIFDNKVIGVSGLHKLNYLEKEYHEFGFILNENYWGKGLATEIGSFWLEYAKNEIGLTELIATVSPTNIASKRVLEKLKMEYLGEFKSKERGDRLVLRKSI